MKQKGREHSAENDLKRRYKNRTSQQRKPIKKPKMKEENRDTLKKNCGILNNNFIHIREAVAELAKMLEGKEKMDLSVIKQG